MVEAIQHQPAASPARDLKDRLITRRGAQARNIAKTAAARKLLTCARRAARRAGCPRGSIGTITEEDVHQAITDRLGLDGQHHAAFMADIWREYLGTANKELIDDARRLRPRYRTGILSNSFVGARQREQAAYGFDTPLTKSSIRTRSG